MAYIGRPLQVSNLAVMSAVGDGSDTTPIATLDYATTTNGIAVYLDGVRQLAGTDFNVTNQTTLTFTTAPANGVGIDVYFLGLELSLPTPADNTVSTAKIVDNAVTLAKMAGGTDGQIITYDASGDPVAVGPGTDGQVLTSTGAGSPPAFEDAGGGAWNIIGTNAFSSTTSVTITGLDSTYDTYALVGSDIKTATDDSNLGIRLGDSSGIDSGVADYAYHVGVGNSGSSSYVGSVDADTDYMFRNLSMGNATGEGAGFMLYLHRPGDGSIFPVISGTHVTVKADGTVAGGAVAGQRLSVITVDRVNLYERSSANMSGRFTIYGIAHA